MELTLVYMAALATIWFFPNHRVVCSLVILTGLFYSHYRHHETLQQLGFRIDNLNLALRHALPCVVLICLVITVVALLLFNVPGQQFTTLLRNYLAYLLWGTLQQYLLNGYFVRRLASLLPGTGRLVPLIAAILFMSAHIPNLFLMALTLAGGYFAAAFYLRYHNLFVLGFAHATIGFTIHTLFPDSLTVGFYVGPHYFDH